MTGAESHVFVQDTVGGGRYHREMRLEDDGSMVIIGHDLGETEYEFERRISPDGVRRLLASIPADRSGSALAAVREAFTSTREIELRLEELQIETEFWNRIG